jgi:hypothetical protein
MELQVSLVQAGTNVLLTLMTRHMSRANQGCIQAPALRSPRQLEDEACACLHPLVLPAPKFR